MKTDPSAQSSIQTIRTNEAIEQLLGIVSSVVADGDLHDLEIEFLKVWLTEHTDVARSWPGSAIGRAIDTVLADGHVSEEERVYLMTTLKELASAGQADGAAASGEDTTVIPLDDTSAIDFRDSLVCLAGEFLHGTRAACERLLEQSGAWPVRTVSKDVRYLVIGTKLPSDWHHTSDGQSIQQAIVLQQAGHTIVIVSERRWLENLESARDGNDRKPASA